MGAALPIIGIGLTAAGMGADIAGQKKAAAQEKRQALLAQAFARDKAADAISRGGNAVARTLGETDRTISTQQASSGGRGFEIGIGTAQHITDATNLIGSIDAITIRENARREAKGYMVDAYSAGEQAKNSGAGAGIFGTLLGGASSIASQWSARKARNQMDDYDNPGVDDGGNG